MEQAGLTRPRLTTAILLAGIAGFAGLYLASIGPYWNISPDSASYVGWGRSLARGAGGGAPRLSPPPARAPRLRRVRSLAACRSRLGPAADQPAPDRFRIRGRVTRLSDRIPRTQRAYSAADLPFAGLRVPVAGAPWRPQRGVAGSPALASGHPALPVEHAAPLPARQPGP